MGSLDSDSQIVTGRAMEEDRKGVNGQLRSKDEPPQIHYFAKAHSATVGTILILIFYHMMPFTALPNFGLLFLAYYLQKRFGHGGSTAYFGLLLLLLVIPPYYSKTVRRRIWVLYEALAMYLPSAKLIIVPKEYYYSGEKCMRLGECLSNSQGDLFQTAAGGFFNMPFARNWFYMIGIMPASKKNIVGKLRNEDHAMIAVGSVREVCLGTSDDVDLLCLKKRRGFLQIAMDEGAGVVSIYAFNENQLVKHDPKAVLNFWQWVNNNVKIGVPFMRGMFNLPMPYRNELLLVFGDALFPKEGESIEDSHERYLESIRQLLDKYVGFSPDPNHKIIIK